VTKTVPAFGTGPPFFEPFRRLLSGFSITRIEEFNKKLLTLFGKFDIGDIGDLTSEIVEYIVISVIMEMDEMLVVRRCNACTISKKRELAGGLTYN
jgi:hypothetical protein